MKEMGDKYEKEQELYERDVDGQSAQNIVSDSSANEKYSQEQGEENKAHKNKKKRKSGNKLRSCLTFLQHMMLTAAAVSLLMVVIGSVVIVNGRSYSLDMSDSETQYEDSDLFSMLYGEAAADIIRFGVIRSQLETNGVFDGKKIIDVTAYNYRNTGIPEEYITARYYLEDLLKWGRYGVEASTEYMTLSELNEFLSDKTMLTIVDPDSKYYNTSDANYMKSDIGNYTFVDGVSANMLPSDDYGRYYEEDEYGNAEEKFRIDIQVNRYKTADGKNIEEYTADLPSYKELCYNVGMAIQNLGVNYDEYLSFMDIYDSKNTNIRYCIEKTVDDHTEYFTNMDDLISINELKRALSDKNTNMSDFFKESLNNFDENRYRYLYYSPSEMTYESNTDISESTVGSIVRTYDYAYPDNIRIWIGVDTCYSVNDAFYQGSAVYNNYTPYVWQIGIFAVVAVILYLILFVYLTITTGKETDENGKSYTRLTEFDKIPTEGAIILAGGVAVFLGFLAACADELLHVFNDSFYKIYIHNTYILVICAGVIVFLLDVIFTFFYYSAVRRIRARVLWKNSYLRLLIKKCYGIIKDFYNHSNIVFKTWGPLILFILFNLLMAQFEVIGIIIAVMVDILCGVIIYRDAKERQDIVSGIGKISEGDLSYQIEPNKFHGDNVVLAESVNSIGKGIKNAVEISMKDERMKTELITNVSHDIKTPLTSIINYVDLIKREKIDNENVRNYIRILDEKSQRLKQLIDDLVEASKISSGNINLHFEKINLTELLNQTIGEFSEKFEQKGLSIVMSGDASNVIIEADSRSMWRVIENLFNNVYKYSLEHTRVYVTLNRINKDGVQVREQVEITIKNISANELNCNPEELTERFIRGDESRTTEGSGLGLSIAKNLTEAQNGTFEIQLDGDLFKVVLTFPVM
ncbi:MAG: HAMP domain-containing histidine kinase [Lachnospiraceae bacterium]|nr:HAMP domain-containing histidine kinase [Lachnospiraceae bacterium]